MSKDSGGRDRHLQTLERWKRLELEAAQAEHLARRAAERQRQQERVKVLEIIASAQDFTRNKCDAGGVLSPETLLLGSQFASAQQQALCAAEKALDESRTAAEKAREDVLSRSEHLQGIEKLRERRREQRAQEEARKEQARLDEDALLKLGSDVANDNRNF